MSNIKKAAYKRFRALNPETPAVYILQYINHLIADSPWSLMTALKHSYDA